MARNVLITGVSSGLGEALARLYLDKGWNVFGLSRRKPVEDMLQSGFHHAEIDLAQLHSLADNIRKHLYVTTLDLVVLNAGVLGSFGDMADVDLEEVRNTMDINVWANKVIVDCLVQSNLCPQQLVAISSGASTSGSRGWNGYGISKAALNMLIKLYAAELPDTHFCALAPGLIDSRMQEYLCTLEDDEGFPILQRLKANRNTVNMPKPEEAARQLVRCIEVLPRLVKSGEFTDIRELQEKMEGSR